MYIKVYQRKYNVIELTTRASCGLLIIYFLLPWRFASHYDYLNRDEIEKVLVAEITRNISLQYGANCEYGELLARNAFAFVTHYREKVQRSEEILAGGEYYPEECRARYSTAIIVPYRHREEQLHAFLIYMHNVLRQQQIHYRIFLVEQYDKKPFNRAKLFNIGATIAANEYEFPCLILHDVDLMPLNEGQIYACSEQPRHMCSALDTFRFNLPYGGLFGGVVAIQSRQYHMINGMSNLYEGWGGEDDDLYYRLLARNYKINRFEPAYSEYTMLSHKRETPNENRGHLLSTALARIHNDGLNTLVYKEKERRIHSLFTHILVET